VRKGWLKKIAKLTRPSITNLKVLAGQGMENNDRIIESWNANARSWTDAVRMKAIETRRLVTDEAVLDAILRYPSSRVLDVGCGEGWLSKKLLMEGREVFGFDASPALIAEARRSCNAGFMELSYQTFTEQPSRVGTDFDIVVCNFSLLDENVSTLLKSIHTITKPSGHLVIQTVHPHTVSAGRYEDGWREETFTNLPGQWTSMPWFFRTMSSWIDALTISGWSLSRLIEPVHPETTMPASLILDSVPRTT
jgi:2-polyprenyl-3-methyl-5-hydroxy-6-metoxy-1,4-benzoquinol methylase